MNSGEGTSSRCSLSSKNRVLHDVKYTTDEHQSTYDLATLRGAGHARSSRKNIDVSVSRFVTDELTFLRISFLVLRPNTLHLDIL
jgi:hypothetical protein